MHERWLVRFELLFFKTRYVLFVKCFSCKSSVFTLVPGAQFDYLEKALDKFDDGPFFLGQFSQVITFFYFVLLSDDVSCEMVALPKNKLDNQYRVVWMYFFLEFETYSKLT